MKFETKQSFSTHASSPTKNHKNIFAKIYLLILCLVILVPLFYLAMLSFKNLDEYYKGTWPQAFRMDNYRLVLTAEYFWRWCFNSAFIAVVTLGAVLMLGAMSGYVVAKFSSPFVRFIAFVILGAIMIPVHMVLMPVFIFSRQVGIINTPWSVIGPGVTFGIPLAMFIFRGFFMNIPDSLAEAARIDGASEIGVFVKVMLPMTKPAAATVGIFTFLGAWNGFLFPLVMLQNTPDYTLPVGLATIGTQWSTNYPAQAAAMILVSMPMILVYTRFNKQVIQGMVEGAVKG